ncbi:MAG: hypothetical protein V1874_17170 [Spirochaetota bacterium]
MAKIKEEAERIKSGTALPMRKESDSSFNRQKINIFPHQKETGIWRLIKKIQYKLQQYSFYSILYKYAVKFKTVIPKYKK